jgi:hypothetical protein
MHQIRFFLAALLASIVLAPTAQAVRLSEPVLIQATANTEGDIQDVKLRLEPPRRITFSSTGDVEGGGTATTDLEVYEWDFESGGLGRLTNSGAGRSWDASRTTDITQTVRGEYVAFVSTGNLDPSVGNIDANPEIFIRIRETGEIRQITNTGPTVVNNDPYPSDSGRCLVFSSTGELNTNPGGRPITHVNPGPEFGPYTNPDGSEEVFMMFIDNDLFVEPTEITQLSNGPAGTKSSNPVIGGFYYPRQCNSTFYLSDTVQSQTESLHLEGTPHMYEFVKKAGRTNVLGAQEIATFDPPSGNYQAPAMSSASNFARGPFAVFVSDADIWANSNSRPNLFRYRSFHPRMTQYTDLKDPSHVIRNPGMSDGGRFISFESNANLNRRLKSNSAVPLYDNDGNFEIWRMQKRSRIQQITDSPAGCENSESSLNDRGLDIGFRSTCDLIPGHNPSGVAQVFYYLQVKKSDPLSTAEGCKIEDRCCNVANGCYKKFEARTYRPNRKNCIEKDRCDEDAPGS